MIDLYKTLSDEHVDKITKDENKKRIFEKAAHSFVLLEQLPSLLKGRKYIFKGGTSLLLLFDTSSRFSIDIDICVEEREYENILSIEKDFIDEIKPPFERVEMDRTNRKHAGRNIKCAHFRFYYSPKYSTYENYVLLDVVFHDNSISSNEVAIKNPLFIQKDSPLTAKTICVDDLFADKLTAFAPNTIGVKYNANNQFHRPKCCEVIKQLYDCAYLSKYVSDIFRVVFIYTELARYQITLEKDNALTIERCLGDTINTCLLIISEGKYGDKSKYNLLLTGLDSFNSYKFDGKLTDIDLKKLALILLIASSKIYVLINSNVRKLSKIDYLVSRSIKDSEMKFYASAEEIEDFNNYCLLDIKL